MLPDGAEKLHVDRHRPQRHDVCDSEQAEDYFSFFAKSAFKNKTIRDFTLRMNLNSRTSQEVL
jgi:hypothetical protein